MSARTSIALVGCLAASCAAMSCAAMSRGALLGSTASYTPAQARLVQRSLDEHGYRVEPTGVYDERTRAAVTAFQRAQGIEATGDVDAATARALGLNPSEVAPARDEDWEQDDVQFHAWHDPGP